MNENYYLALYLLALAGFLLWLNLKSGSNGFAKAVTYIGMWAALVISSLVAFGVMSL